MIDVTYNNFLKLFSENLTIEEIRQKDKNLRTSIERIKSGSRIYIWPAAVMGETVFNELKKNGFGNLFLVDKNNSNIDTISPDKLHFSDDDVLIISTLKHSNEIYHLAKKMECKNIIMYYDIKELGERSSIIFPDDFYDRCFEESTLHLLENKERYIDMYNSFEDDASRKTFLNNMFFRLTFDIRYTFDEDKDIQYFDDKIVKFNNKDVLVDGGGYNGDTLEEFLQLKKDFKAYYLFEPDKDLVEQAKKLTNDYRVHFVDKGLYSCKKTIGFNKTMGENGSIVNTGNDTIEVISIDDYFDDEVTFIKMDIEGAELEALIGAERTIKKYSPTLAICVYHKPTDYLDIFEYIKSLNKDYKFYLRHHRNYYAEAVLYALKKGR